LGLAVGETGGSNGLQFLEPVPPLLLGGRAGAEIGPHLADDALIAMFPLQPRLGHERLLSQPIQCVTLRIADHSIPFDLQELTLQVCYVGFKSLQAGGLFESLGRLLSRCQGSIDSFELLYGTEPQGGAEPVAL
jgi:hypothetical protein